MAYAVLGPAGTFSEEAARRYWGSQVVLETAESIDKLGLMLADHQAEGALAPLYNSLTGWVNPTLEILRKNLLLIKGHIELPVRQHLMVGNPCRLQDLEVVISHPLALRQCSQFIARNLGGAVLEPCSSTAGAARALLTETRPAACIGSYQAARMYGLKILRQDINLPGNITHFVHIAAPGERNASFSLIPGAAGDYRR